MNFLVATGAAVGDCFRYGIILGGSGAVIGCVAAVVRKNKFDYWTLKDGAYKGGMIGTGLGLAYVLVPKIMGTALSIFKKTIVDSYKSMQSRMFWIVLLGVGVYLCVKGGTQRERNLGAVAALTAALMATLIVS